MLVHTARHVCGHGAACTRARLLTAKHSMHTTPLPTRSATLIMAMQRQ
ncbi:MAG: hypothetical protein SPE63_09230 [Prevotella sp.]|nr:hypothetical protein [Prevotella sp.]MDY5089798.1 hypothetical protein [Prevotella sp.]MDY5492267.1 hypothetical protein [Prevotella sp.]